MDKKPENAFKSLGRKHIFEQNVAPSGKAQLALRLPGLYIGRHYDDA
jgi:hypothetical protein